MSDPLMMSATYVETLSEPQAAAVMSAWVAAKRIELPEALARSASKVHARLAKKALYQLRSGGVAVPEAAKVEEPIAAPSSEPDTFPAVMTSLIGNGERGLLFARPVRGGGCEIYESVVQDEQGIMSLQHGEGPRGLYRERMKQLRRGPNQVLFVPFDRVREELARAVRLNSLAKVPLTLEAQALLGKLGVEPNDTPLPIGEPHDDDPGLAAHAGSLHDEPEMASWLPPDTDLAELARRLENEATAPGVRKAEIASELSLEFATQPIRALYATRLWRMAEFFEGTARNAPAQTARAEARQLLHTAHPSRFLEMLFTKVPAAASKV